MLLWEKTVHGKTRRSVHLCIEGIAYLSKIEHEDALYFNYLIDDEHTGASVPPLGRCLAKTVPSGAVAVSGKLVFMNRQVVPGEEKQGGCGA